MKAKVVLLSALLTWFAPHATCDALPPLPRVWIQGQVQGLNLTLPSKVPATGLRVSALLDEALGGVPPEARAELDLVQWGEGAVEVPRALLSKYPISLVVGAGGWVLHLPWEASPTLAAEALPLKRLDGRVVARLTLTSYKSQYRELMLTERSDPWAMRGEKVFLQNCVSCHRLGLGPTTLDLYRFSVRGFGLGDSGSGKGHGGWGEETAPLLMPGAAQRAVRAYLETWWEERAAKLDPFLPFPRSHGNP